MKAVYIFSPLKIFIRFMSVELLDKLLHSFQFASTGDNLFIFHIKETFFWNDTFVAVDVVLKEFTQ